EGQMMTRSTVWPKPGTIAITKAVRPTPDTAAQSEVMTRPIIALAVVVVVSGFSRTVSAQTVDGDLDPRIVKLVASVSEERLGAIEKKLESFETRNSLSSTTSTARGIGAARQWIFDEMKSYSPKLQVSFDTYQVPPQGRITRQVELRNVMAILPG